MSKQVDATEVVKNSIEQKLQFTINSLTAEVERLRAALERTKERYWAKCYEGKAMDQVLSVAAFDREVDEALSGQARGEGGTRE